MKAKSTKSKRKPMARKDAPKATGRPPVDINPEVVEAMAFAGAMTVDIADFLGVSADTIERRFAGNLLKSRGRRRVRLRQIQWRSAEGVYSNDGAVLLKDPSVTMQIWLGKQELGQTDRQEFSGPNGTPFGPTEFHLRFVKPRASAGS